MLTQHSLHTNNCSIYPGAHAPLHNDEEIRNELKKKHEGAVLHPFINVSEHRDHYKVEAAIPGVKREDFLVNIDENILSISVLHKKMDMPEEGKFRLHEFNYECFNRNIILPQNAEKDFVKAEYREGLLSLYFPKSTAAANTHHTHVIVY